MTGEGGDDATRATPAQPGGLNWLPCGITGTSADGPAPVSAYFRPVATGARAAGLDLYEASFRGRRLVGAHYPLPPGYAAYLLHQPAGPGDADASSTPPRTSWPAAAAWPALTAWSLDAAPGAADPARRALDWLGVAAAAAAHVDAAAVDAAMTAQGGAAVA